MVEKGSGDVVDEVWRCNRERRELCGRRMGEEFIWVDERLKSEAVSLIPDMVRVEEKMYNVRIKGWMKYLLPKPSHSSDDLP